eukprot:1195599-Prorocentrum_minimum.AAC.5
MSVKKGSTLIEPSYHSREDLILPSILYESRMCPCRALGADVRDTEKQARRFCVFHNNSTLGYNNNTPRSGCKTTRSQSAPFRNRRMYSAAISDEPKSHGSSARDNPEKHLGPLGSPIPEKMFRSRGCSIE